MTKVTVTSFLNSKGGNKITSFEFNFPNNFDKDEIERILNAT